MDLGLWRTFGSFDILPFIRRVITSIYVMWEAQPSTVGMGLFQASDFAGDFEDSKSTSRDHSVYLRESNIRSHKIKMLRNCSKFQSRSVQIYGYVFHDTIGRNHGQALKTLWFLLIEIRTDTHLQGSRGKVNLRKFYWGIAFEDCTSETRFVLVGIRGQRKIGWKETEHVDFEEPTRFLDHVFLGCTQRDCKSHRCALLMHLQR